MFNMVSWIINISLLIFVFFLGAYVEYKRPSNKWNEKPLLYKLRSRINEYRSDLLSITREKSLFEKGKIDSYNDIIEYIDSLCASGEFKI